MAEDLSWVPPGVDTGKASIARVYDYWLGGDHNIQADRDAARAMLAVDPNIRVTARANRAFLGRAVRFAAAAGVRQFLDLGSGVPTQGNVHEIAQDAAAGTRVVYADIDPVAVAHGKAILAGNPAAAVIGADLRDPGEVLGSPEVRRLIDFSRPVAVLLAAVLQFVPDADDPWRLTGRYRDLLAPGSYLVISHVSSENMPGQVADALAKAYQGRVDARGGYRSREAIGRFFGGFELVDPGLVRPPEWRPDSPVADGDPGKGWFLAGVGRKP